MWLGYYTYASFKGKPRIEHAVQDDVVFCSCEGAAWRRSMLYSTAVPNRGYVYPRGYVSRFQKVLLQPAVKITYKIKHCGVIIETERYASASSL